MSYPLYREFPGDIVLRPDYRLQDCKIYGFIFESNNGDKSVLQQLCDERLNFPTDWDRRYVPLSPNVMVTFARTPFAVSTEADDSRKGYIQEDEIVFWILTIEYRRINGEWQPQRPVWFVPYIFVNNVFALLAGRELYGYPKTIGTFNIPEHPAYADLFTINTMAFKTFSPNTQLIDHRLVEISRTEPPKSGSGTWSSLGQAVDNLKAMFYDKMLLKEWTLLKNIGKVATRLEMPLVFLKQFRHLADPGRACYQAIVEGPIFIDRFHEGGLLPGTYDLTIHHLDSFPLSASLGLPLTGLKTSGAFWLRVDFTNIGGDELWKAER